MWSYLVTLLSLLRYEGQWEKSYQQGEGKMTYADGSVYEGTWERGVKHGKHGKYTSEASTYEGEWKEGWMHCKGVQVNVLLFLGAEVICPL